MPDDDDLDPEQQIPSEDLGQPQQASVPAPRSGPPYDPEQHREQTRGWLAFTSIVLLALTVGVILGVVAFGGRSWDEMEGVAACVMPAVLGVVSTVLGFYFGTRSPGGRR